VDSDPRRRAFEAHITARWGLIPVYPWTTTRTLLSSAQRIHRAIGRQHQDAAGARRAQLAIWLRANGIDAPDISRHVWSRRKGLQRPSAAQAIARLPLREERKRIRNFMAQGLSYEVAERRLLRELRGREDPASAAIRVAVARYYQERKAFNAALTAPTQGDPAAHAVTMLLRAALLGNDAKEIRRRANAARDALLNPPLG
jgi:hypothetical protein